MNYRHAFHAGNFADVLKHAVLCWVVRYLQQKEAPLCLIDTHAGRGVYDLRSDEALRTLEARDGVLRLLETTGAPAVLSDYFLQVQTARSGTYPGSPVLLARLARPNDRIVACELHPEEAGALRQNTATFKNFRVLEADGYRKLASLIPPPEKRGLVLMDPPFEHPDELSLLASNFIAAHRKWPTGVFLLWFPIKDASRFGQFKAELKSSLIPKLTLLTLDVNRSEGLSATGLMLANAPYTLEADWRPAMSWLVQELSQGPAPDWTLENLSH